MRYEHIACLRAKYLAIVFEPRAEEINDSAVVAFRGENVCKGSRFGNNNLHSVNVSRRFRVASKLFGDSVRTQSGTKETPVMQAEAHYDGPSFIGCLTTLQFWCNRSMTWDDQGGAVASKRIHQLIGIMDDKRSLKYTTINWYNGQPNTHV